MIRTLLVSLAVAGATEESASSSRVAKSTGPPSFFLQDPTDGLCLSGTEFKRCAIDTLWYVTGKPGSYLLHHRKLDEVEDETCLDRVFKGDGPDQGKVSRKYGGGGDPFAAIAPSRGR